LKRRSRREKAKGKEQEEIRGRKSEIGNSHRNRAQARLIDSYLLTSDLRLLTSGDHNGFRFT
jgi:hypothetical protein